MINFVLCIWHFNAQYIDFDQCSMLDLSYLYFVYSMLIASQLEPTYARTVYPCFDEPAMKATFNIRIIHDPSYVALSNMPAIGR